MTANKNPRMGSVTHSLRQLLKLPPTHRGSGDREWPAWHAASALSPQHGTPVQTDTWGPRRSPASRAACPWPCGLWHSRGGLAARHPQLHHHPPLQGLTVCPPFPASWGWPACYLRDWPLLPCTSGVGGALVRPCHWPGTLRMGTARRGAGSGSHGPGAPGRSCGVVAGLLRRGGGRSVAEGSRSWCTFADEAGAWQGPQAASSKHQLGKGAASGRALPRPPRALPAASLPSPRLAAGLGRLPRLLVGVVQAGLPPGAVLDGGLVQACHLRSSWLQPLKVLGRERRGLRGSFWHRGGLCRSGEAGGQWLGSRPCGSPPPMAAVQLHSPQTLRKGSPSGTQPLAALSHSAPFRKPPWTDSLARIPALLTFAPGASACANPLVTCFSCSHHARPCRFLTGPGTPRAERHTFSVTFPPRPPGL